MLRCIAPLITALMLLPAVNVSAYQLRMTPDSRVLIWDNLSLMMEIDTSAVPKLEGAQAAIEGAFEEWVGWGVPMSVSNVSVAGPSTVARDNSNRIFWETQNWEYGADVVAMTISVYNPNSAIVNETDIVFNGVNFKWTTDPTKTTGAFDVQNVVTHEVGHLFGLGHASGQPDATMFASTPAGEVTKRALSTDDRSGVSALVEEMEVRLNMNLEDFDPDSIQPSPRAGCSVGGESGGDFALMLGLLFGLFLVRRRSAIFSLAIVLLYGGAANATVVRAVSMDQLVANAPVVFEGKVLRSDPRLERGLVFTYHQVEVSRCHRGACSNNLVTVRTLGGEVGDVGVKVEGMPVLKKGEQVLLFGRSIAAAKSIQILGFSQGLFRVEKGMAVRDTKGLMLVNSPTVRETHQHKHEGSIVRIPVDQLRQRIAKIKR
jgi:MYXO-CTERM domain-containing protein